MSRHRRVRRYARPECTMKTLRTCIEEERTCRACPPLPPEGLAPWLHRIGFYKRPAARHREARDEQALFMRSVKKQRNGCWLWHGRFDSHGVPIFYHDRRERIAHRWAYAHWRVELPPHRRTTRTCGNRRCVNPRHVQLQIDIR